MPTANITVSYVNQPKPGRKMGSIKDVAGDYYNVWPDKLNLFQPNASYQIEYTEKDGFKTFKQMLSQNGAVVPQGQPVPRMGAGTQTFRPTAPQDAERMWVCSLVNAGIQAGQVQVTDTEGLKIVTEELRYVWQQTFGKDTVLEARAESAARIVQQPARTRQMPPAGSLNEAFDDAIPEFAPR